MALPLMKSLGPGNAVKRRPDRQQRHAALLPAVATENPLPTDIRRLVAAVERQTAVAEQQLCVAARQ